MSAADNRGSNEPSETPQRRPTDALWFTILFASITVGIGMTIFAPVGDEPPPTGKIGVSTTAPVDPFIAPATTPSTTTSSPSTRPLF